MKYSPFGSRCFRAAILLACVTGPAVGLDYAATPLSKAVADHPIVMVAEITEQDGDKVTAVPVVMIKGRKEMSYELPAIWSAASKFYEPLPLKVGQKYLLMLKINEAGRPIFSTEGPVEGARPVASVDDPMVCAAAILHRLSDQKDTKNRERTLATAWKDEVKETKVNLMREFLLEKDEATIPFLMQAMNAGAEHADLMDWSANVIQRHGYQEAVPELLNTLKAKEKDDWTRLIPATTLGKLKAKEAYEPIMETIQGWEAGDRQYFIHALCYLEDPRSAQFLTKTLQEYRDKNQPMNEAWVEPLKCVMEIPDRDLQLEAVKALRQMEWFRANAALAKVRQLRDRHADDAEFRQAADAVIEYIDQ